MITKRRATANHLSINRAYASHLVDALAWAVVRGISFQAVIRSLPFYAPPHKHKQWLIGKIDRSFTRLGSWVGLGKKKRWRLTLNAIEQALDAGEKLSDALSSGLTIYKVHTSAVTRHLPSFFLSGLQYAEEKGRLKEALPLLACQIRDNRCAPEEARDRLWFCLLKIMMACLLGVGVNGFLGARYLTQIKFAVVDTFNASTGISSSFGAQPWFLLCFLILFWVSFLSLLLIIFSKFKSQGDWPAKFLPWFRDLYRRGLVSETAACLSFFLKSGTSMPQAVSFAMGATRSQEMKKKLHAMLMDTEAGIPWQESWAHRKVGMPHDNWFVQNAAQRENPADGFMQIDQWNQQQNERATTVVLQLIDPVLMIMIGALVGACAIQLVSAYAEIIQYCYDL